MSKQINNKKKLSINKQKKNFLIGASNVKNNTTAKNDTVLEISNTKDAVFVEIPHRHIYDIFKKLMPDENSPSQQNINNAGAIWKGILPDFMDNKKFVAFMKYYSKNSIPVYDLKIKTYWRGMKFDDDINDDYNNTITQFFKNEKNLHSPFFTSFSTDFDAARNFGYCILTVEQKDIMPKNCHVLDIDSKVAETHPEEYKNIDVNESEIVFPPGIFQPIDVTWLKNISTHVIKCKFIEYDENTFDKVIDIYKTSKMRPIINFSKYYWKLK